MPQRCVCSARRTTREPESRVDPSVLYREGPSGRDAYVYTLDPDALFEEFRQRDVSFVTPLSFIDDGLWGFEITDADGYVLAFFQLRDE